MSKKITWRICFVIGVLLVSSLACEYTRKFTEWYREDIDDDEDSHLFCSDYLVLLGDSKIICDESQSPKAHTFSGKVYNNSDYYAHDVSFEVFFDAGLIQISCPFNYGEIAPGATLEALCQFKAPSCVEKIHSIDEISCKLMTYTEHLEWLVNKDKESPKDPAPDEESSEEKEPFVLTQSHIDHLNDAYRQSFEDNPCQPDIAQQAFLSWLQLQAQTWSDEAGKVIGEGKQFSNVEVFGEWLTLEAKINEVPLIKNWSSDFDLAISPLVSCFACTPSKLTGDMNLTVDLKTCQVTGKVIADGEGNVTINDCVDNKPIDKTCTSHGILSISGDIAGTTTKDGQLTLDPTKAKFTYSTQWVAGCEWDSQDVQNSSWEDPITLTGSLNWKGTATLKVHWTSTACAMNGDWQGELH